MLSDPFTLILFFLVLLLTAWVLTKSREASNHRRWKPDHNRQPYVVLKGSVAHVYNLRNARYGPPGTHVEVVWEDRCYDLDKLERLWLAVEPFNHRLAGVAHTFLSFEFEDDVLALSVEARLEEKETFSVLRGFVGAFDLLYSLGTERDFITRRTRGREHDLYLYPLITPPDDVRAILRRAFASVGDLTEHPRFYHSVTNNCTSSLVKLVNAVRPGSFPSFMLAQVLPGRSDTVLYRKGWIDTAVALAALRESHNVREKAERYADDPSFSERIRYTG